MRGSTALVAVTMLLGGCASGAAEPASTTIGAAEPSAVVSVPSVEVSVEADDAEELEPPEMPALAREQTPEGAVAFAEWWYALLNYSTLSGDVAPLVAASHAECGSCSQFITDIQSVYDQGGSIAGGQITAEVASPGTVQEYGILLAVSLSAEPVRYLDSAGHVTKTLEAERVALDVSLAKSDTGWLFGSATQPS